jgi:hypothetical protein
VGAELRDGVTPEQVASRFANVRHFGRVMAGEAGPRFAGLAHSLTERQLDELAQAMDKSNRKYRRDFVDVAYPDVVAKRASRTRERLEFWAGPLTPQQRQVVDRWSASLEPAQAEMLTSRERWQKRLRSALARRDDSERLGTRLTALMSDPERWYTPELLEMLDGNRARTFAMVSEVSALMTEQQRRKVLERTESMAKDFEAVACLPPVRNAGTAPSEVGQVLPTGR